MRTEVYVYSESDPLQLISTSDSFSGLAIYKEIALFHSFN